MVIQETEKMIMGTLHERKKEKQNKKKNAEKSLISFQMMPKNLDRSTVWLLSQPPNGTFCQHKISKILYKHGQAVYIDLTFSGIHNCLIICWLIIVTFT